MGGYGEILHVYGVEAQGTRLRSTRDGARPDFRRKEVTTELDLQSSLGFRSGSLG